MDRARIDLGSLAKRRSGWFAPAIAFFVTACLSAVVLAYYFAPGPPGLGGELPEPTDATRPVALTIGPARFRIPANYVQLASSRRGGTLSEVSLAAMLPPGDASNKRGSESKTVADLLVGVTQVFGPRTLGRLDYSFSRSSGYLTDPYKVLSVVDPVTGAPVPGPGALDVVLFESRPDARTKHSLFAQVKRQVGRDVLDGSYRFMTDDWGVVSHTLDLRWRHPFRRFYLQPHVRLYRQGAADFYRRVLFDGDPLPQHASADYRLGELDGTTLGLKLGVPLSRGREWNVRIESYEQSGRAPPEAEVGALAGFDLFPTVDALIVQAGYRF